MLFTGRLHGPVGRYIPCTRWGQNVSQRKSWPLRQIGSYFDLEELIARQGQKVDASNRHEMQHGDGLGKFVWFHVMHQFRWVYICSNYLSFWLWLNGAMSKIHVVDACNISSSKFAWRCRDGKGKHGKNNSSETKKQYCQPTTKSGPPTTSPFIHSSQIITT